MHIYEEKRQIVNCWNESCVYNYEIDSETGVRSCKIEAIFVSLEGVCMSKKTSTLKATRQLKKEE